MAHKAESFKIEIKKTKKGEVNVIVLYTNVEANPAEKMMIERFLNMGYEPMFEEKKVSKSVAEMREELSEDKEALAEFDAIYAKKASKNATKKEKSEVGFFGACKYYSKWAKEQKKAQADAE
ncbi:MAG: hypothetical protein J6C29_00835 [Clostridia bacterium]|nr:hypothetical protein [Clostridia bacterium]